MKKNSNGDVFTERFNRTIRGLLKRIVFEKGDGNWIDILPKTTKQCNNRVHSSTKLTPIQGSLKKMKNLSVKIYWTKERKSNQNIK